MNLAYIRDLKTIGTIIEYSRSLLGGKYLIEIDGSQKYYKASNITPLNKEFTNKDLWRLVDFKLLPDGAEFKNNRGISIKLRQDKLVPLTEIDALHSEELYKLHDKWIFQKV